MISVRVVQVARWVQQASLLLLLFLLPISKAASEILFLFLLLGWILQRLAAGGWHSSIWARASLRPLRLALLVYLALCVVSILTSSHPDISLRGLIGKTLEYLLFVVFVADVAAECRRSYTVIALLGSAVFVCGDAIAQEIIQFDLFFHHVKVAGRMTGPFENPSDLASYLVVIFLIALALLRRGVARSKAHWGLWAVVLLLGGCLVRTESQAAWAGCAVGMLVLLSDPHLRGRVLWLGGVFVLAALALLTANHRLQHVVMFSDIGVKDRVWMWQSAWRMIMDHPVRGVGLNTFMANYLSYWVGGEQQPRYAHNCYLQTAAEIGIPGLLAFLALLWQLMARMWAGLRHVRLDERPMLLGLLAGLAAFLVQSAGDTNFYAMREATMFWVLAGVGVGFAESVSDLASSEASGTRSSGRASL